MTISVAQQAAALAQAAALGLAVGLLYDLFRVLRVRVALPLLGAVLAGIAGLMTSYYVGSSAGAAITLYLAVWFLGTFLARKKQ